MRYSSTMVLGTLAIGQAAAAHNRHASFHARREASKRGEPDWNAVAYDLKDVDWASVFATVKTTPTPKAQEPAPVAAAPTAVAPKKDNGDAEAKPSSSKVAETSQAAKPTSVSKPILDIVDDFVDDLMANVEDICKVIDSKVGINSKTANGGWWIGSDGATGLDVTNNGNDDAVWICWVKKKGDFTAMTVNVNTPAITVGIPKGKTISVSLAPGVAGACAPATKNTPKSDFGGVKNAWLEMNAAGPGVMGVFNVSREPAMKGCNMDAQGSTCRSGGPDLNCVFVCKDPNVDSCGEAGSYYMPKCDASSGGGQGFDVAMQGVGGGCNMPDSGDRIKVTFD